MSEPLVRGKDLLDPVCGECDHVEGFHGSFGCRFGAFVIGDDEGRSPCGCKRTHHDVHLAHVESIVRREVEKALGEVSDVLRKREGQQYVGQAGLWLDIARLLESRMGADWRDGGQR